MASVGAAVHVVRPWTLLWARPRRGLGTAGEPSPNTWASPGGENALLPPLS